PSQDSLPPNAGEPLPKDFEAMSDHANHLDGPPVPRDHRFRPLRALAILAALALTFESRAHAGKVAWLDDVVQHVIRDVEVGGRATIRGADELAESAARG